VSGSSSSSSEEEEGAEEEEEKDLMIRNKYEDDCQDYTG